MTDQTAEKALSDEDAERLLDIVLNEPTAEQEVSDLEGQWRRLTGASIEGGPHSQGARIALLEARLAYLTHAFADLLALVETVYGNEGARTTRKAMGEFTALDMLRGGYVYALDTAEHREEPTFDWYGDGRPTGGAVTDQAAGEETSTKAEVAVQAIPLNSPVSKGILRPDERQALYTALDPYENVPNFSQLVAAVERLIVEREAKARYFALWHYFLRLPGPTPFSDAVQREAMRLHDLVPSWSEVVTSAGELPPIPPAEVTEAVEPGTRHAHGDGRVCVMQRSGGWAIEIEVPKLGLPAKGFCSRSHTADVTDQAADRGGSA